MTQYPTCYIMVGVPGSGKSTFLTKGHPDAHRDISSFPVASSDNVIDEIANRYGFTYDDVFQKLIGFAEMVFWDDIDIFLAQGVSFVIDRTNLTVKSRSKLINLLKEAKFNIIAVDVKKPDETEWRRRLASREGKTIPENVLYSMVKNYQEPTLSEGFHKIIVVE